MRWTNGVFLGDASVTLPYDLQCRKLIVTAHQTRKPQTSRPPQALIWSRHIRRLASRIASTIPNRVTAVIVYRGNR
jgi:hypothetical protein